MKKIYGYARVSTAEQNTDRQINALIQNGVNERDIIVDKASGKNLDRTGYISLKEQLLREGDTLVIKSLDRLSRNKADIKNELEYFRKKGVRLKIIDLPTTMIDLPDGQEWVIEMVNNIMMEVLSSIAEQERIIIRQRQREGINAAKARGQHLGRRPVDYPADWKIKYEEWKKKEITAVEAMRQLGLKKTTFYKLVKQYEGNNLRVGMISVL